MGQAGLAECDRDMVYWDPTAQALDMPFALAKVGLVSPGARLTGQPDFASTGDSGLGIARRAGLCRSCWPSGRVADDGNNRVLLWKMVP